MDSKFHRPYFDPDADDSSLPGIQETGVVLDDATINKLHQSLMGIKNVTDFDAFAKKIGVSMQERRERIEKILAEINNPQLSSVERLALQKKYFGEKK